MIRKKIKKVIFCAGGLLIVLVFAVLSVKITFSNVDERHKLIYRIVLLISFLASVWFFFLFFLRYLGKKVDEYFDKKNNV